MASLIGERMAQASGLPKARDTVWASTMPVWLSPQSIVAETSKRAIKWSTHGLQTIAEESRANGAEV
jgi:hypothetical protein